jgi:hypothetical protein
MEAIDHGAIRHREGDVGACGHSRPDANPEERLAAGAIAGERGVAPVKPLYPDDSQQAVIEGP